MQLTLRRPVELCLIALIAMGACSAPLAVNQTQPANDRLANSATGVAPTTTSPSVVKPAATSITTESLSNSVLAGIYFHEGLPGTDGACTRFYRLYSDGYVVFMDACSAASKPLAQSWARVRDYLRRWDGYAMGPWTGGFSIDGRKIQFGFVRVRSTAGDEVLAVEGQWDDGVIIIDGARYEKCVIECVDAIQD